MDFSNMDGMQVLWYLLTHWEEGKGLWMIIGFATVVLIISAFLDWRDIPPTRDPWHLF